MRLKVFLIFSLPFFYLSIHAQEREKITRLLKTPGVSKKYSWKEVFHVMGPDKIMDGEYNLQAPGGKIFIRGFYKMGRKDSTWDYYNGKEILMERDRYRNGDKTGVWEFNDYSGTSSWSYDFDSALVHNRPLENKASGYFSAYQNDQGDWLPEPPEKLPLLLSSIGKWYSFITANLSYPDEAVSKNQQGTVYVSIWCDENGESSHFEIFTSSGSPALDAEALRVVTLYAPEFVPAENKGKKIKAKYVQPINFKLESQ